MLNPHSRIPKHDPHHPLQPTPLSPGDTAGSAQMTAPRILMMIQEEVMIQVVVRVVVLSSPLLMLLT